MDNPYRPHTTKADPHTVSSQSHAGNHWRKALISSLALLGYLFLAGSSTSYAEPTQPQVISVKSYGIGRGGQVFVASGSPINHSEHQEAIDALWKATPDGKLRDEFRRPIKRLPFEALSFVNDGRKGNYLLLKWESSQSDQSRLRMAKAVVSGSALAIWACMDAVSLTELAIVDEPLWVQALQGTRYWGVSIEFPEEQSFPSVEQRPWEEIYDIASKHEIFDSWFAAYEPQWDEHKGMRPEVWQLLWPDLGKEIIVVRYMDVLSGYDMAFVLAAGSDEQVKWNAFQSQLPWDYRC